MFGCSSRTKRRRWLLHLAIVVMATGTAHAQTQRDIRAVEIAQLPPFCWSTYMKGASGPEYSIDKRSCGSGTNHYCPALVELIRAKGQTVNRKARMGHLMEARNKTLYTIKRLEKFPGCTILGHVQGTLREVEGMLKGLGVQ
jgi:hypothetical protein